MAEARWEFARLRGRIVEIFGNGARLTAATRLVYEAQLAGEPVAWIVPRGASFFPPDVASHGVDLDALAVIRAGDAQAMLRAADQLLRAGAFGLVVLDASSAAGRAPSHGRPLELPLHVQVRLANLARGHDAVLLLLLASTRGAPERAAGRSSFAAVRALSARARRGSATSSSSSSFTCSLRVVKDKRAGTGMPLGNGGREWEHVEVFRGPMGLR